MRRVCFLAAVLWSVLAASAQLTRVPNTTLKMPQNPAQRGYSLVQQFGRAFTAPVALVTPPGETNRLFIVEEAGRISLITNVTAANPTILTFLDIQSRVLFSGEQGLLGLAFHPNYKDNGYFYVFYVTPGTRNDRLSRFKVSDTNPNAADPNSEVVLLNQLDDYENHNAGDLHFGPDGYLYVSLGDEGGAGDTGQNSQRIDKDFFSGILRLDVDKRPGNLPPNAHASVTTNYFVPADNPFVGATNFNGLTVNPSKVHTEFWAVGLRNPWRMSFDRATGLLWVGDVGQDTREEVDIITKGGNYGWNYREGTIAYRTGAPAGFHPVEPVYDYARSDGNCVIGGVVYRGSKLSQLYGSYVFGDNGSGNIWALRTNSTGKATAQRLLASSGIGAFGVDPSNGDVLVVGVADGWIRRLQYSATTTGTPLPATLADTGAFTDSTTLTVADGIVPYQVNLPFWSDGATKRRWFSIPDATNKFTFNATNAWLTPTGAVWIKHFEMQMTNGDAASSRRLETRFIVRNTNGVYGVTYRWTNATDAVLVPEEGLDEPMAINDGGTVHTQVWHYPSRAECLTCHNAAAGLVLGFKTPQMNGDVAHGALTTNQIKALAAAGYLSGAPQAPQTLLALARPDDSSVSQEFRVRSYLDANCSQCHRPGGFAVAQFDARVTTPTDAANLISGQLYNNLGDPANRTLVPNTPEHSIILQRMSIRGGGQMPPISSNVADPAGVALLREFITGDLVTRKTYADWQTQIFQDSADGQPNADPDSDGAINILEFLTGTNPKTPGDAWGLKASATTNGVSLNFTNPANRGVVIESANGVADLWTPLDSDDNRLSFPSATETRNVTDTAGTEVKFYRARVVSP